MVNKFLFILLLIPFVAEGQSDIKRFQEFQKAYERALEVSEDSSFTITQKYLNSFSGESFNRKLEKYKADHYFVVNERQIADSIYRLVLPTYISEKDYTTTFSILNRQGHFYYQTGKLLRGIEYSNQVQEFIDANKRSLTDRKFQIEIAELYRIIGIIYAIQAESNDTFNQETSEAYFKKAYEVLKPLEEYELEGLVLFNIGNVMTSHDSIIHYWNKALDVFDRPELQHKKGFVYQNLAIHYIDMQEYQQGLAYLDLARPYFKDSDRYDRILQNIKYGKCYLGLEQYATSIPYLESGLDSASRYEMTSLQGEAYELLISSYKETGQYEKALNAYIAYDSLVKGLERIETERIFRETEAKYKTKEQKAEIDFLKQSDLLKDAQLQQQRLIIGIVAIALLLILFLSYFFWKQGRQRKKLNAQLHKLNKDRTRFLVNISHELRTPVSLIHGPLQDAFEQLEKNDLTRVQRNLNKISNNAQKVLELTEEVLDLSKLDEGFLKVDKTPVELKAFLTRVFYAFESLAVRNGIEWTCDISIDQSIYEIDENKLEKILNNLLSNAIKNTPKNGRVKFTASIEQSKLSFQVIDSGKGISPEAIPKIFDRYYQDDSVEKPSGGIGIGLSLVKELTGVLNGTVQVDSELKKGTSFVIEIPIQKSDKVPVQREAPVPNIIATENRPEVDLSNTKAPHILVIEDNIEMADFIQQLLSDDYRVSMAHNGEEGIQRLQSDQFDLITVDLMMPRMDGIQFMTRLKEHPEWKSISSIMITALSQESDKIKGLKLGVDDYMTKPFSGNELKARVHNLIKNSLVRLETDVDSSTEKIIGAEKELLNRAKQIVESNIGNNDFSVKDMADFLNLSERQTNRVLKKATGLSCLQFIREVRLQFAYQLILSRKHSTIAEISYAVGFENASYFTRIFTNRFGKKPSEVIS